MKTIAILLAGLLATAAGAQSAAATHAPQASATSLSLFAVVILITLGITWWAARRTTSTSDFYAAGGGITGFQNGLAITGDALSAGAFLGLTALVFGAGFDGLYYAIGYTTGLPVVVFLMAGKLRKLGKYTFTDVVCAKLPGNGVRVFSACASLTIVCFYLIAQMVGAGQLVQLLFGIDYAVAIMLVGALMILYVVFGGMLATTWVQIVKAVLMLGVGVLMAVLVLRRFDFDFGHLLASAIQVHPRGADILGTGTMARDPWSAFSLGLALMFGTAGLPHVLMRFFTVKDARAARTSVMWAAIFMNGFYALIFIIGFGALALVRASPAYLDAKGAPLGGGNTAALHLSHILGGDVMFGVVSAVAFATILAVVAGLTLSGASAISHDIYGAIFKRRAASQAEEFRIVRIATVVLGAFAVLLGIAFKGQNVAYMISLAFSIACSSTFPVLLLAIYWKKLTSFGAVLGGGLGIAGSLALTVMGPSVWVKVLGHAQPLITLDPPALVTVPLAFLGCYVGSVLSARVAVPRNASMA
ncbi:sodium:solute symporter family transporter [Xylophilus sp. GOD-11R]|uniref:sodium:solute symporter family transporter n=1 Tax=Xylophilus sp. GOD-11R TaxID=3089814 RepID=UPI00298CD4DB|nr:cation acetate symporter [Xylophilus sp. GOD-11R]WPB55466.1 cation acetate symporter [Xylophilus sp. GOD-11R]